MGLELEVSSPCCRGAFAFFTPGACGSTSTTLPGNDPSLPRTDVSPVTTAH